ncbi:MULTISPECIES: phytanoyl-CoA dioxygenase family protein [unclassified Bradyrhizobium]|uniref:phytanoyl-CoA dioxygenase family protein n=1 Tax=unclassified Bradyrhizobium TaxID=2631580 RepID=UPI002916B60B|nr:MULTISPECIES: phytanoyl-CoA dioxygenase family protein [unclassified Bradyrhizobium]
MHDGEGRCVELGQVAEQMSDRPGLNMTRSKIEAFAEDGFVVVEQILAPDEVELIKGRYEKLFRGEFETSLVPDELNWLQGRDAEDRTRQICNGWKSDRYIADVVLRPEIGRACATLGGWPGARLSQDNLIWKPSGGKPLGFHQDSSYERWCIPSDWVSCWIALDDTTAHGGTVEYVRGSHRWEESGMIRQFHAPDDPHEDLKVAAQRAGVNRLDLVPIEVPAGAGVFHSGWTWHGSDVNRSDRPRRALVAHCMSSEARFHPSFVGYIYSRYKRFGDDIMDETHFPIIWREDGYCSPFIGPYRRREISWGATQYAGPDTPSGAS